MALLAVVRVARAGKGKEALVYREAVLGRRQGDPRHALAVWVNEGGAAPAVEVVLEARDALLSRQHARLFFQDGQLYLQDLGSTNGTFLNGREAPKGGRGGKGAPVPVPHPSAEVRLGDRCVLSVTQVEAPLGLQGQDWGRLSASLSYRDMTRVFELWRWGEELQQALAGPLTPQRAQEWFARGKKVIGVFPDVAQDLEDQVRRLALHLFPDDVLEPEEKNPLEVFCRDLPARLNAHYLNR